MPGTTTAPARRAMKKRDIIKFTFAAFLGLVTVAAIAGLTISKAQRRAVTEAELQRIEKTMNVFGSNGVIPAKAEVGSEPKANVFR